MGNFVHGLMSERLTRRFLWLLDGESQTESARSHIFVSNATLLTFQRRICANKWDEARNRDYLISELHQVINYQNQTRNLENVIPEI